MSPRWNTSERTYLLNLMDEFFVNGEVRDPSVVDWPRVIRTMTIEQARHRPDGALYEQDPWPIRTYNIELLISAWRHARIRREKAARKISDQIMQENDPEGGENELSDDFLDSPPDNDFEARFPDNWAREFEEILAPLRHDAILKEPADRPSMIEASREVLARMGAERNLQADFWADFEKRFGSQ
ncbi:predicted protein [Sclerotinia sclerotiorum 1980 UF-70]|uniref:Uncharacterized protein n=2 Tax=Sclerotinia sclerotiorum (strain ATCC 18683 / 1980 / Ss-1) TaxID=665079 RepID=A7E7G6_SCLS1|nr:predicted protein [Sclerotinia sclerotiorum 1980 UF-70]APA06259.1 hypothetical protein sscle_01g010290 [Sclerotinia sclerotiorum 1980 UF-70]EDN96318.1 predicted protein [Sclerotinia sclerotiorum 1980 UF-70]